MGDVNIQILNDENKTIKTFYWLTNSDWGVDDGDGWYEDPNDPAERAEYLFKPCEGFIMTSAAGAIQMQNAGSVQYPVQIPFRQFFQLGGNPWPKTLYLSQMTPTGENVNGMGDVNIQILNDENKTIKTFYWLTNTDWGVDDGDGWYEDPNDPAERAEYPFAAGEGFIMTSAAGAITLNIPELAL